MLTPVDQARETEVLAEITGEGSLSDFDLDAAPGFGAFSSAVDANVQLGELENPVTASSDGLQSSDILAAMVTASGSADAVCSPENSGLVPNSYGRSFFSVKFTLADPTEYLLSGMLTADSLNGGLPLAFVTLESTLDGEKYYLQTTDGPAAVLSGGLLPAGEYTLSALALAEANPSDQSASASFDIEFRLVPEPSAAALLLIGALTALRSARRR